MNVFDYDIGAAFLDDSAIAFQPSGPDVTLVDITGSDGTTGQRGVYGHVNYTVDTLSNVLTQVQVNHFLNNTAATGMYDVAGAFLWSSNPCSGASIPECNFAGSGSSQLGGFTAVPEPSTAALLLSGLVTLGRQRRRSGAGGSRRPAP